MGTRDLIYETWLSLTANKARSLLTILGIIIGIASVIAMTSLIGGMQNMFMSELGLQQARMIQIISLQEPLNDDDLEAIAATFPEYQEIGATAATVATVSKADASIEAQITGVTANYGTVQSIELESGRSLTEEDQRRVAKVVMIGKGVAKSLFGSEDAAAIGETLRIGLNGESYTVIGVLVGSGTSQNYESIIMPVSTLQVRLTGSQSYDAVFGLASEGVDVVALSRSTQEFLVQRLNVEEDMVFVYSMQEMIEQVNMVMAGFSFMLTAIASISLFVGGIGIMNMMLTNVTERTREIGLRKSLGAHTSDITRQFLAESISLCIIGGIFGIIFGYLGA
ncbi:MAG: FtsX-like permease family protein, partial [Coriobacteriaceae bacterium]|nr:FtsX-like permease family protein [Coriobacteriaceae bacterium]